MGEEEGEAATLQLLDDAPFPRPTSAARAASSKKQSTSAVSSSSCATKQNNSYEITQSNARSIDKMAKAGVTTRQVCIVNKKKATKVTHTLKDTYKKKVFICW